MPNPKKVIEIENAQATGADISKVLTDMAVAFEGHEPSHVLMACIVMAIGLQAPELEGEKLADLVFEVSQFITSRLSDGHEVLLDPSIKRTLH